MVILLLIELLAQWKKWRRILNAVPISSDRFSFIDRNAARASCWATLERHFAFCRMGAKYMPIPSVYAPYVTG
jgi:hypothetical protein